MTNTKQKLGRRIASLRKKTGLTQAMLSERLGVSVETLSRLERGTTIPSLTRLYEIATLLNVQMYEIFQGERASSSSKSIAKLIHVVSSYPTAEIEMITDIAARMLRTIVENRTQVATEKKQRKARRSPAKTSAA